LHPSPDECGDNLDPKEDTMNIRALGPRGFATLSAILILAATTTVAQARMGGIGIGPHQGTSNTTAMWGRHLNTTGYPAPPVVAKAPQRQTSASSGGGGTGGFNPGGGSGTKPTKKPNVQ
jgi:uncharacterized membrane protein YgcG